MTKEKFAKKSVSKKQQKNSKKIKSNAKGKWSEKLLSSLEKNTQDWKKKDRDKFGIDLLAKMIGRVEEFSKSDSKKEAEYKKILERMLELVPTVREEKDDAKEYIEGKKEVLRHLQMDHKLVLANYYTAMGIIFGSFIGILFWWGNIYIGAIWLIGAGLLGSIIDMRMEKKGRVI